MLFSSILADILPGHDTKTRKALLRLVGLREDPSYTTKAAANVVFWDGGAEAVQQFLDEAGVPWLRGGSDMSSDEVVTVTVHTLDAMIRLASITL